MQLYLPHTPLPKHLEPGIKTMPLLAMAVYSHRLRIARPPYDGLHAPPNKLPVWGQRSSNRTATEQDGSRHSPASTRIEQSSYCRYCRW